MKPNVDTRHARATVSVAIEISPRVKRRNGGWFPAAHPYSCPLIACRPSPFCAVLHSGASRYACPRHFRSSAHAYDPSWTAAAIVLLGLAILAPAQTTQPAVPAARRAPNPAYAAVKDDPTLPRVLLIGDSISIGYTVPTREKLKGKANVHRPGTNCGPTTRRAA